MTWHVDAAIVGGGPAGAIAARRLAQRGWRVVMIERGAKYRDKTCGHCLAPRALPMLRREGLSNAVHGSATGATRCVRVHSIGSPSIRAPIGSTLIGGGVVVPRDRFDHALREEAEAAGAIVLQPAAARMIRMKKHHATLRVVTERDGLDVRCTLLIGADGLGSAVARAASLVARGSVGRKYGFSITLPAANGSDGLESGAIEMFIVPGGYVGAVRSGDDRVHLAALIGGIGSQAPACPADVLRMAARRHHRLAPLLCDATIERASAQALAVGPMAWHPRAVSSDLVALIGDAAGYVEPFTGEGMTWAIESAILLADSIAASGDRWTPAAANMYSRLWRERIGRRHSFCGWVATGLERPLLTSVAARVARLCPSLAARCVRQAVAA